MHKVPCIGSITALITPFGNDNDQSLDLPSLEANVQRQVESGTSGVVPCGTSGESATMNHHEHIKAIRASVNAAAGRIPVIAGTGSNCTSESITLTLAAKKAGAAAALLISPYYIKPTQEGIFQHYKAIAEATDFPLIIYNIPGRTASMIEPETIERLAALPQIVGLKAATGNIADVIEVRRRLGKRIVIYSGDDQLTYDIIGAGGDGVISVTSNILPCNMANLVRLAMTLRTKLMEQGRGDVASSPETEELARLINDLQPIFKVLFLETNPIPIKAAAFLLGHCENVLRLPLLPMSSGPFATLAAQLAQADHLFRREIDGGQNLNRLLIDTKTLGNA